MKKIILLFFLLSFNYGNSQFHLGEDSRTIYKYFKDKSEKISFRSYGHREFLVSSVAGVRQEFYFNDNDICTKTIFWTNDRDAIYQLCDTLKIPLEWNGRNVYFQNKKIWVTTFKQMSKGELLYSISIEKSFK